jgi:hypothetical protein
MRYIVLFLLGASLCSISGAPVPQSSERAPSFIPSKSGRSVGFSSTLKDTNAGSLSSGTKTGTGVNNKTNKIGAAATSTSTKRISTGMNKAFETLPFIPLDGISKNGGRSSVGKTGGISSGLKGGQTTTSTATTSTNGKLSGSSGTTKTTNSVKSASVEQGNASNASTRFNAGQQEQRPIGSAASPRLATGGGIRKETSASQVKTRSGGTSPGVSSSGASSIDRAPNDTIPEI